MIPYDWFNYYRVEFNGFSIAYNVEYCINLSYKWRPAQQIKLVVSITYNLPGVYYKIFLFDINYCDKYTFTIYHSDFFQYCSSLARAHF